MLFLTYENEFSGYFIVYLDSQQYLELKGFGRESKVLKISSQKQSLCPKIFLNREFSKEITRNVSKVHGCPRFML